MAGACSVPGCRGRTTLWGRYCPTHAAHARRHGHPEQRAVTKAELRPFETQTRGRIERNAGNALWAGIEANWKAMADHARRVIADYERGHPIVRQERLAAEELVKLVAHVDVHAFMVTALAMFLLQQADERRFKSDQAFRAQLVRRVRGLAEINAGVWTDAATGRRKLVYRELPPKVSAVLAGWIVGILGGAGVLVARLEQQQQEERQRRVETMAEGARALV